MQSSLSHPSNVDPSTLFEELALSLLSKGCIGAFSTLVNQWKEKSLSSTSPLQLHQETKLLIELETQALLEQPLFNETRNLALFYMEFHPEAALPFALRALDLAQTEEEKAISHLTLGDRWTELGHFEKAFSHYFQALPYPEALKKWVATSLKLGQEHEKRKEWSEAVELYKNTLTQSSDVSLLLRLGLAELALDQLEDAKMHLKSFISNVDPSTSEAGPAYIALAQAHEKCQAYDEAIDCLSSYFHSFTSTGSGSKTEAGVHLAQLLNRLDRWDEAQRVLQGIQLNDDACVQWGIARGNGYWKEYLTHLQGPPKLFLEFLNQIEHQVQNKANV